MRRNAGLLFLLGLMAVAPAAADVIGAPTIGSLTLLTSPAFKQTFNNPCIFQNPSCPTPPFTFGTGPLLPSGSTTSYSGNTGTSFTLEHLRNVAMGATTLFIAFDINEAGASNPITLHSFTIDVAGLAGVEYVFHSLLGSNIFPINPGNGESDAVLAGFSLAPFAALPGNTVVAFSLDMFNLCCGAEQVFLVRGGTTPIPEPATLILFGSALLGLTCAEWRRRKRKGSVS